MNYIDQYHLRTCYLQFSDNNNPVYNLTSSYYTISHDQVTLELAQLSNILGSALPYSCHGSSPPVFHLLWVPESWVLVRIRPNFKALAHTTEDGECAAII